MRAVTVRSAQAADVEGLTRLLCQLGYPDAVGSARLEAMVADPRARVLVAVDDRALLGLATLFFVPVLHENGPWCRITALVVDEKHRGLGVGEILVAAAEQAARTAECSRIEATSALRRTEAHEFYAALGYTREAEHFLKRLATETSF